MDNENEDSDTSDTANKMADSDDCSGDESQNILENLLTDVGGEDGDVDYLEEMVNQAIENGQDVFRMARCFLDVPDLILASPLLSPIFLWSRHPEAGEFSQLLIFFGS